MENGHTDMFETSQFYTWKEHESESAQMEAHAIQFYSAGLPLVLELIVWVS